MVCKKLTGTDPFQQVYLHNVVRDKTGRKMSKSLGNVIDPLHIIEGVSLGDLKSQIQHSNLDEKEIKKAIKNLELDFPDGISECGSDALRFTLLEYMRHGRSINLDPLGIVGTRHFCNKIWQATKYSLSHLTVADQNALFLPLTVGDHNQQRTLLERWILSKLSSTVETMNKGIDTFQLASSTSAFRAFFISDFCDNFIEFSKASLHNTNSQYDEKSAASIRRTILAVLDTSLRLSHPLMPFITEELWQKLPKDMSTIAAATSSDERGSPQSIMVAPYPTQEDYSGFHDEEAEKRFGGVLTALQLARSLKGSTRILFPKGIKPSIVFYLNATQVPPTLRGDIETYRTSLMQMAGLVDVTVSTGDINSKGCIILPGDSSGISAAIEIPTDPETVKNIQAEVQRLEKKLEIALKSKEKLFLRTSSSQAQKLSQAQLEKDAATLAEKESEVQTMQKGIDSLKALLL